MRPGQLAAVSLVAAVLGGVLVLAVARAAGWLHRGGDTTTVVQVPANAGAPPPSSSPSRWPATASRRRRSTAPARPGVVTIYGAVRGTGIARRELRPRLRVRRRAGRDDSDERARDHHGGPRPVGAGDARPQDLRRLRGRRSGAGDGSSATTCSTTSASSASTRTPTPSRRSRSAPRAGSSSASPWR